MVRLTASRAEPFLGEIEAAVGRWLHIEAVGGPYGTQALVRAEPPLPDTPRAIRAMLLARAEDAFDALPAAGLKLARQPDLEFRGRDWPSLQVWFSVTRA